MSKNYTPSEMQELVDSWSYDDCIAYLKDHKHDEFFKSWLLELIALDGLEHCNPDYFSKPSMHQRKSE